MLQSLTRISVHTAYNATIEGESAEDISQASRLQNAQPVWRCRETPPLVQNMLMATPRTEELLGVQRHCVESRRKGDVDFVQ